MELTAWRLLCYYMVQRWPRMYEEFFADLKKDVAETGEWETSDHLFRFEASQPHTFRMWLKNEARPRRALESGGHVRITDEERDVAARLVGAAAERHGLKVQLGRSSDPAVLYYEIVG